MQTDALIRTPLAFGVLDNRSGDRSGFRAFWRSVEGHPAGAELDQHSFQDGSQLLVVSGWACEVRAITESRSGICSLAIPGDVIDIRHSANTHKVVALTVMELVDCRVLLDEDLENRDSVSAAIQQAIERREHRIFDHLTRVGRLSGRERVLHLLLELNDRLEIVGRAKDGRFRFPLTQDRLAEFLGLSPAHLKRTLHALREDGLISVTRGDVTLNERPRLAELACYQGISAGHGLAAA
ncbi:MAG: transcriptional regulator, Crp/Fnr family [Phenylobacterium sp.]|nr:transcriptional regulator, Crp/Fnr family [Phenylobacterium sp.]